MNYFGLQTGDMHKCNYGFLNYNPNVLIFNNHSLTPKIPSMNGTTRTSLRGTSLPIGRRCDEAIFKYGTHIYNLGFHYRQIASSFAHIWWSNSLAMTFFIVRRLPPKGGQTPGNDRHY